MATSRSAPSSAGTTSAADLKQLQEEVKRLRAYKVMAEKSLAKMGVDLQAALKQGWVSKRAEVRRKRLERKKAAEAAKWAKNDQAEAYIRRERKKVGLPVRNPTPTPSEAAYLERVAEAAREEKAERLRNRVRRMSHQLLIAAAIGHQYRDVTGADQPGHVVPGGADSGPPKHNRFDPRSEMGLTATEAMARSFRNWANKAKEGARSRSRTPSTVYVSSRTTGPEDTPSGSESDSSFTDDNAAGAGIKGPKALRAIVYDPSSFDEDDITDAGEELGGLADLDLDDVSDEVLATAYGMLAKAERTDGEGDWADVLASNILVNLIPEKPNSPPSSTSWGDTETEDGQPPALSGLWGNSETETENESRSDKTELTGEGKTQTILDFFPASPSLTNAKKQTKNVKKVSGKKKKKTASKNQAPKKSPASNPKYTAKATQTKRNQKGPTTISPSPSDPNDDTKGPSRRAPHKPEAPDQSVWDPTWWRVNKTDYYDGVWADKVLPKKQPTNKMETGFMLWQHQEERFPHLDDRLKLQPLYHNVIFKPEEVDTYSWDPVNRAVTEPKTGLSAPLRLGPITVHSLARWKSAEFGGEYSRVPVQMPDSPSIEERKRSLPSAMLFKSKEEATPKKVAFASSGVKAHKAIPKPVASVHYPLKSPAATSISAGPSSGYSGDVSSQPETPTAVTLYEHIEESSDDDDDEEEEEEEERNLDAYRRETQVSRAAAKRAATSSFSEAIANFNGKRPAPVATAAEESFISQVKKRRAVTVVSVSSSDESEKENGEEEELEIFSAAAKEFWNRQRDEPVELALSPPIPGSGTFIPGAKKKAVRFDVSESGPSHGMRDGARRALGRYGLTSSRRGPYR
ncbi:hypothetical protein FHL15_006074 [Xylaria flabelliformis]|uniref:Uncharacterized protein n=1 Tax=Xylaria flabelliformis TaxID=2512241 RepID=A0A553HYA5_9PEZI|nr:hypothetical protein FHL15_006074 [Xylaria flabelliformis]